MQTKLTREEIANEIARLTKPTDHKRFIKFAIPLQSGRRPA